MTQDWLKAPPAVWSDEDPPRIGWPHVLEYEIHPGKPNAYRQPWPPRANDTPYRRIAHDLAAVDELDRLGLTHGPDHTGRRGKVIDNRAAPQE